MPPEIELEIEKKFTVPQPQNLTTARDLFLSMSDSGTPERARQYHSVLRYFDTHDGALQAAGVTLRTVDAAPPHFGAYVEIKKTLKSDKDGMTRMEYNFPVEKNGPDLSVITDPVAQNLLAPLQGRMPDDSFQTDYDREEIRAAFTVNDKRIVVELSLDDVYYKKGEKTLRHDYEVEIEPKTKYSDPTITAKDIRDVMQHIEAVLMSNIKGMAVNPHDRAQTGFALLRATPAHHTHTPHNKKPNP
ncbi:MAG: hypothetical protein OXT65_05975 [Alphaproteobacteria bacterium]|nr:hypothetical protein [Alphaproteobacteria bacterium]